MYGILSDFILSFGDGITIPQKSLFSDFFMRFEFVFLLRKNEDNLSNKNHFGVLMLFY